MTHALVAARLAGRSCRGDGAFTLGGGTAAHPIFGRLPLSTAMGKSTWEVGGLRNGGSLHSGGIEACILVRARSGNARTKRKVGKDSEAGFVHVTRD